MLSIAEITARENIYQFFTSLLLKEPSEQLVEGLIDTIPYLKEIFAEDVSFSEWDHFIKECNKENVKIDKLQQDFYDFFFVPTSGIYSPAVESITVYNKMWSETEIDLANRYEKVKFVPEDLDIYTPFKQLGMSDLLGFELGYMAHLCNMETYSTMEIRERVKEEELNMLETHLIPFINKYYDSIKPLADGTIYSLLVELIRTFVELDREFILNSGVISYA